MNQDAAELWDKFWRDDKGRIVIWQTPNLPLIGWAVFTIASLIFNSGSAASTILTWLAVVALLYWAYLEIFKGVNYFRRLLGVIVLILNIISIINLLH
ncbi:MAG TPA: hypothetical protein VFN51_00980 [Candidatus Saccharimonadales bacterium]|nr:hypothetical protein [Candidatus Saccharimonadales bacterium]